MADFLLVLADGFEEIEALGTADILKRMRQGVTLAGLESKTVRGAHGIVCAADEIFSAAAASGYDGIILPGGLPGATNLAASSALLETVRSFDASGKIVAAICAAPLVLFRAGILSAARAFTMYPGFEAELSGLVPTGNLTERSGNLITGRGPGATPQFARQIALAAGVSEETAEKVLESMFF